MEQWYMVGQEGDVSKFSQNEHLKTNKLHFGVPLPKSNSTERYITAGNVKVCREHGTEGTTFDVQQIRQGEKRTRKEMEYGGYVSGGHTFEAQ